MDKQRAHKCHRACPAGGLRTSFRSVRRTKTVVNGPPTGLKPLWTNGFAFGANVARIGGRPPHFVHGQGAMSFLGSAQKLRIAHHLSFVALSTTCKPSHVMGCSRLSLWRATRRRGGCSKRVAAGDCIEFLVPVAAQGSALASRRVSRQRGQRHNIGDELCRLNRVLGTQRLRKNLRS